MAHGLHRGRAGARLSLLPGARRSFGGRRQPGAPAGGALVMLNKFPYNSGHLLIAPVRHTGDFAELHPEEVADLTSALQRAVKLLQQVLTPDGFNLGMNLGKAAGAGIADHLHFHAVPRWNGDTNFMPVLAETKVINEH